MNALELANLQGALGSNHMINQLRKMEQDRSSWMKAMTDTQSLADQLKKFVGQDSAAVQAAKQIFDSQRVQEESMRKMLDPLANIRHHMLGDSFTQRMIDDLSKPFASTDQFAKLTGQINGASSFMDGLHSSVDNSMERARLMLAETSVSSGLQQMMKQFEDANKHWAVPSALMETISPLKAWQEQFGKISLPVMDWTSAATLAKLLGPEGLQSQLAALGINPDGSLNPQFADQEERGIGLSRKTMELMALLSFFLAVLVPMYQEYSSGQSQAATDKKFEAQADAIEGQRKMIESLTRLVEKALVKEAKQQEQRFVVKERVAVVFVKPESGATEVGKLLPKEVVRPISEEGKWIEIEYYHWLYQEYRTGWVLKKYFQRVARPAANTGAVSGGR